MLGRTHAAAIGRGPDDGGPGEAGSGEAGPDEVAALLAEGHRALIDRGDLATGRRWYDRAYRAAERAGDAAAMAAAAIGLGGLWVHEHRHTVSAGLVEGRQRHALALLPPWSTLALRLRARLAAEADYRRGTHADVLAALDAIRSTGDRAALAEALSLAHHCLLGPDHGPRRQALAAEMVALATAGAPARDHLVMGLLWLTVDEFLAADRHAERSLRRVRELLAGHEHLAAAFVGDAMHVMLHIRAGRFADAERLAARCAERGTRAGDSDATGWYGGQLVAVRWYQGRLGELLPLLSDLVDSPTLSAVDNAYLATLAIAAATAGDHRQAAGALARLRGHDLSALPRSSSWLVAVYAAVEAACLLRDTGLAREAYALLTPHAGRPMMVSLAVACFGSVQHALGVAALTTGDLDVAVGHFRSAVRDNLALGHWPAAVLSRFRLGQALTSRGAPGDHSQAHQELATAAREAADLDMALPALPAPDTLEPVSCHRHGRLWTVRYGSRSVSVEHSVGMAHLAALLAYPGREISAVTLAGGPTGGDDRPPASRQPILDRLSRTAYERRLTQLETEIAGAEAAGRPDRATQGRAERDWLRAELGAATGLGGRPREFTGDEERARVAVGKAIRRAIGRIALADPVLGQHLRATVRTGARCSYRLGHQPG